MILSQTYRLMIKLILSMLVLMVTIPSIAQTNFYNNGERIKILEGTSITIRGDYVNGLKGMTTGKIASAGEIRLEKNLINNTTDSVFVTDAGRVEFYGDSLQEVISDSIITFHSLEVNKPSGELQLQVDIDVSDSLVLSSGNLHLNTYDIDFGFTGSLFGETNDKRIYGALGWVHAKRGLTGDEFNIAGLGLSIESSVSLGTTAIHRAHAAQAGASNGSINRYYSVEPSTLGQTLDKVMITYLDTNEVNVLDEAKFSVWTSDNDGLVWDRQSSIPLAGADSVISDNVVFNTSPTLITLAESICDSVPVVDLGLDTMYLCMGDTLEIDAKNPGLFFQWNTLETTQKIDVTTAGSYSVIVINANGCIGVDTTEVILKPYPVLDVSVSPVCQNDSSVFVNNSSISADTMAHFWDFGDALITSDTSIKVNPVFLYDTTDVYAAKLTLTSEFGCVVDTTIAAIVHANPVAQFSATNVCLDSTTIFSNNSTISSGGMQYKWDFGDINILSDTSEVLSPTYVYAKDTTYNVQLVVTSNNGCTDTSTNAVIVHPTPVPDFSFVDVGENISIQLQNLSTIKSGNLSYDWDFGDGVTTQVEQPTKSYAAFGTYTILLKATSDFACNDTVSKVIQISDIPVASFTVNDTCASSVVEFNNTSTVGGGNTLSYLWKFGDGTTSTDEDPVKAYTVANTYTIWLITTSSTNNIDSTSQDIIVHPLPTLAYSFSNECANDQVNFVNQSFVTSGFNQYAWDFGDGNTSNFGSPNTTYSTDGDFTVGLIATTNMGCKDTLEQQITIYPLPILNLGGVITTCGDSLILDALNPGSAYLWTTSETSQVVVARTSGNYAVTITSSDQCKLTESVDISLNSLFTPTLGADRSACVETVLDAGNPGSQYVWSTTETSRSIIATQSGEYIVEVTDQNNCVGSDTIQIVVNQNPIVDLGNDTTVCSGKEVVLDALNPGATYDWSNGAITQTITVDQTGVYSVIVTDANNCSASSLISLNLFSLPTVKLGDDQAVCESIVLRANNPGASYLWSDGSTADTLLVTQAGPYRVAVTNGNACQNSDTVVISILPKPIVELGDNQQACNNETVIIDAGADGNQYLWNTGATSQLLFASATGTYSVTVTNSDNCSSSDNISVTILDQVEVDLGQDFTLCAGKQVTLDPENVGATFTWGTTADTTYGNDATIVANKAGSYWVEVKTGENCIGTDTIVIGTTSNTVTAQFLSSSLVDVGDTIQFLELSTPDSLNYLWDFDDGVVSMEQDPLHVYFVAGTYDVSLTVANELCSDQITKSIIIRDLREVIIEPEVAVFFDVLEFSVYPNPFIDGDEVNYKIEFTESARAALTLYDLSGKILFDAELEGKELENTIQTTFNSSGMYILKLKVRNQSQAIRLIKL